MVRSLQAKLAIVLLVLLFFLGLFVLMVTQFTSEMYQQEVVQKLNRNLARQIVERKLLIDGDRISEKGLENVFDMLMVVNPNIEIYLLDPTGKILAFSAPPGKVKLTRVDLEPVRKFFSEDIVYPLTGEDPRNPEREKVFSAARVPEQGQLQAYLYIILGGEIFDSVSQKLKGSYIMRLSVLWIVASMLFALITGSFLFAYLTRRLKRLSSVMDAFGMEQSAVSRQPASDGRRGHGDEIDRLTMHFKQLAGQLQIQMDNLKHSDTLRRELIANVSHDLRTPLATLQGNIETLILKDTNLTAQDRRHHLKIAIKHCQRLGKLVGELFELARLDSYETTVQYEPFNICELVHDVAQEFALSAEKRHITIHVDHDASLPFVNADIAMIERVIENLVENGLRHTSEGGSIRFTFSQHHDTIAVRVMDTGCGISEEQLPHIFDRFYHRDRTEKSEAGCSGLGLAIVKRILELHNQSITVESTSGAGTTFTFLLSAYSPA